MRLLLSLSLCSLSALASPPLLLSGVAECSTDPGGDPQLEQGSASCKAGVATCAAGDTTSGFY